MLKSMTGFARVAAELPFGALTCELRAVNHRYLDVHFRLPEELRPKEIELKKRVGKSMKRGKVECSLHLRRAVGESAELTINQSLAEQIGRRIADVSGILDDSRPADPVDVLRWPGVVEEPEIDMEPLYAAATGLLDEALGAMDSMRQSEGERIAAMIETRLTDIEKIAADVRKRLPEVLDASRRKQRERLDKLDVEADPARLETELAIISQKLDVDEELDRLESHVSEARHALGNEEPVGRRLDFLMQEFNREANTLGSKSADTETTRAAVELKVLIEQMREQIQNVE